MGHKRAKEGKAERKEKKELTLAPRWHPGSWKGHPQLAGLSAQHHLVAPHPARQQPTQHERIKRKAEEGSQVTPTVAVSITESTLAGGRSDASKDDTS